MERNGKERKERKVKVCNGKEWNGMEWNGMEWMEWMEWNGEEFYCILRRTPTTPPPGPPHAADLVRERAEYVLDLALLPALVRLGSSKLRQCPP